MLGLSGKPVCNIDDKPMALATSGKDAEAPAAPRIHQTFDFIPNRLSVVVVDACLAITQGSYFGNAIRWSCKLKTVEHS